MFVDTRIVFLCPILMYMLSIQLERAHAENITDDQCSYTEQSQNPYFFFKIELTAEDLGLDTGNKTQIDLLETAMLEYLNSALICACPNATATYDEAVNIEPPKNNPDPEFTFATKTTRITETSKTMKSSKSNKSSKSKKGDHYSGRYLRAPGVPVSRGLFGSILNFQTRGSCGSCGFYGCYHCPSNPLPGSSSIDQGSGSFRFLENSNTNNTNVSNCYELLFIDILNDYGISTTGISSSSYKNVTKNETVFADWTPPTTTIPPRNFPVDLTSNDSPNNGIVLPETYPFVDPP